MAASMVWSFLSILLYLLCSIGYLIVDVLNYVLIINNSTLYIIYIVLASVLIVEAILYTIDWAQYAFFQAKSGRICEYKFKFLASIFHNIGSVVYLLGGIFGNNTVQDEKNFLTNPQLYVFNIVGTAALFIEAILTLLGWIFHPLDKTKTCHCPHDVAVWAHVLNSVGALVYLVASILPLIIIAVNTSQSQTSVYQNYIRPIQIAGDSVYLIDAVLYMALWFKAWYQINRNDSDGPIGPETRDHVFLR